VGLLTIHFRVFVSLPAPHHASRSRSSARRWHARHRPSYAGGFVPRRAGVVRTEWLARPETVRWLFVLMFSYGRTRLPGPVFHFRVPFQIVATCCATSKRRRTIQPQTGKIGHS